MDISEFGDGVPRLYYVFLLSVVAGMVMTQFHFAYSINGQPPVQAALESVSILVVGLLFVSVADLALVEYFSRQDEEDSELADVPDELLP